MKTKTDISYGVIPYRKVETGFEFFLIYQHSHWRGDSYWVFPKGHAEDGETKEESAKRELYEETSLKPESLDTENPFEINYDFEHKEVLIKKTVIYYLGKISKPEFKFDQDEVTDGGWFTYEEARAKITFANTKKVLNEAYQYLTVND